MIEHTNSHLHKNKRPNTNIHTGTRLLPTTQAGGLLSKERHPRHSLQLSGSSSEALVCLLVFFFYFFRLFIVFLLLMVCYIFFCFFLIFFLFFCLRFFFIYYYYYFSVFFSKPHRQSSFKTCFL